MSLHSLTLRQRLARWIGGGGPGPVAASSLTSQVTDDPGWTALTGRPHDYDPAQVLELYQDALEAWRKNPIAWRIVAITTDFVVGDHLRLSSPARALARFVDEFWNHPQNRMDLRLESMCDELSRSGDLFVLLFRNPADGLSYIRFVTKDRIARVESAPNDWERELRYYERKTSGETQAWLAPDAPGAEAETAVMLHYSVNRPLGALLGESDLTTMLPWLNRYSRMLEDRVRLHWAVRAFLWLVTVPGDRVSAKRGQYVTPPESGSIVVKDEQESWQAVAPNLQGADSQHDLKAVRGMIDAGSGYPPHWRGEPGDANLATAQAMQAPTERHLLRRQKYFTFMLQDILYHAYQRAAELGLRHRLGVTDYQSLFSVTAPDVSRTDNESLARAGKDLAEAMQVLSSQLGGSRLSNGGVVRSPASPTFSRLALRLALKFAGEPQSEGLLDQIMKEVDSSA